MAKQKFAVEITQDALKGKHPFVSFMVDGSAVELNAESPLFETGDESVYRRVLALNGVKAAEKKKDGD